MAKWSCDSKSRHLKESKIPRITKITLRMLSGFQVVVVWQSKLIFECFVPWILLLDVNILEQFIRTYRVLFIPKSGLWTLCYIFLKGIFDSNILFTVMRKKSFRKRVLFYFSFHSSKSNKYGCWWGTVLVQILMLINILKVLFLRLTWLPCFEKDTNTWHTCIEPRPVFLYIIVEKGW